MKILVAEPIAAAGVERLKAQPGWDVVVSDPKGYAEHLADAEALLVRSAVKVTKDVLAKAPKLRVVGRRRASPRAPASGRRRSFSAMSCAVRRSALSVWAASAGK
jgi:phosphoglycerate dehydrogenase-like enzyme